MITALNRFTDCAGLSVLVWAHKRLAEQGHELVITDAQPLIRRVLRLTGLDTYPHLSASIELDLRFQG